MVTEDVGDEDDAWGEMGGRERHGGLVDLKEGQVFLRMRVAEWRAINQGGYKTAGEVGAALVAKHSVAPALQDEIKGKAGGRLPICSGDKHRAFGEVGCKLSEDGRGNPFGQKARQRLAASTSECA